jgi:hypothetical protein
VLRWLLAVALVVLAFAVLGALAARALDRPGSRASVLASVVATWLGAWVLWGFAGGLALRAGLLTAYDTPVFGALAVAGAAWQYRAHVRGGRERGLGVFVAGQLVWILIVLARNGALRP